MPEHEKRRLNYQHEYVPHRTPTLVGCALGIRKDYFLSIGGFDEDMEIWGAENIELAFRVWMCGGQVGQTTVYFVHETFLSVVKCLMFWYGYKASMRPEMLS